MTLAYFDCFSGISGDMTLGALVDAGMSIDTLRSELARLDLPGYTLTAEKVLRSGIAATKVHVVIDQKDLHSRHLSDILGIISSSSLSAAIKRKSSLIFNRLADAEAKVHGTTPDRIHFHEVGAVDSIVDIVGAVIGLEHLNITQVATSAVNVGSGTVQSSHGLLPIPAPATAEMLLSIPMYESSTRFELTTPTGAAIISTLGSSFGALPRMRVDRIAYGAGDQDFTDRPNVLRLMIGEPDVPYAEDTAILIETNIDDLNPQIYDQVIEQLMRQGALDAYLTPIIMKKGRPAILLSVLCDRSSADKMLDALFRETTSIGVRIQEVSRRKLDREVREVSTKYGTIRVKISGHNKETMTVTPEYEDCKRLALSSNTPLRAVIEEAVRAARSDAGH